MPELKVKVDNYDIKKYVKENFDPDEIFDDEELVAWAKKNEWKLKEYYEK